MKQIFKKFCFCVSLETGGYIIGWFYTILGIILAILSVAVAVFIALPKGYDYFRNKFVLWIAFTILAFFGLITTIVGVELIRGIKQKKHKKISQILWYTGIAVISTLLSLIRSPTGMTTMSILIAACFQIYLFLCILSLYIKIEKESDSQQTNQQHA